MKRVTKAFGDRVLRSGTRMFASQYDEVKRVRLTSFAVVDTEENKIKLLDHVMEIGVDEHREVKLVESKKMNGNGTDEALGNHDSKQGTNELGESNKMSFVDDSHANGDNVCRIRKFETVYTRKRKRNAQTESSVNCSSFDEIHGTDKRYEKKYSRKKARTSLNSGFDQKIDECHGTDKMYEKKYFRKKARTSSNSGFDQKDVLKKGPVVFACPCSYKHDNNISGIYQFSCFVISVLRYLRMTNSFSWRRFSSFLLLESTASKYSSIGIQFPQDSTCIMGHGFFKVFGSINSITIFTVNFDALPSCFLYIHSNLLLNSRFLLPYASITLPPYEEVTICYIKTPSIDFAQKDQRVDKVVAAKKARSARRRVPRVSLFNKALRVNIKGVVNGSVPVPVVKKVEGYAEEEYVPFMLPESYISSTGDEVSRILEKSNPIYEMNSDDEQWLKNFKTEQVSEDTFEKIIDAFERGMYCNPHDYSNAASAVDQCQELASKEVLEAVYRYWTSRRTKKGSPLIRAFKLYMPERETRQSTNAVHHTKQSASKSVAEKQLVSKKAISNNRKVVQDFMEASIKMSETREAARRAKEVAIVKRQQAQALMEAADMATYKATMARRIVEARAAGSEDHLTGAIFGFHDE